MDWIQILNQAIEYIEEHLVEEIRCEDVADHVHISSFHFQRAFSLLCGTTIQTYIRNRRLSLAGEELLDPDKKVIDIAFKYGYDSAESFTKAFQRFHGIVPSKVSKMKSLKSYSRLAIQVIMEGGSTMEYRIESHEEMQLCVCSREFTAETSEQEIPKFWKEYYQRNLNQIVPGHLGVCAQAKSYRSEFLYGIGCSVDQVKEIPEQFERLTVPAYTWAIFRCVGMMPFAIQNMWEKIYKEWLPCSRYSLIPDYCIENYLDGDSECTEYVSEIWLPVKER